MLEWAREREREGERATETKRGKGEKAG